MLFLYIVVVILLLASLLLGVRLAIVTVIFFFISSFLSLRSLSINSLLLFLSVAVVLHSPPTLSNSRYLLTQSSHHILCLLRLLFPSTFWASDLFASFSSPILSTWPAHFNLLITKCFLTHSFTPTSTLSSSILVLSMLYIS